MKIYARPQFEAFTSAELTARGIIGPLYRVLVDFRVQIEIEDKPRDIVIPAGFETDWASIPAVARVYLSDDDPRILIPSLVHDWLYAEAGNYDPFELTLTRQECDDVLRRLMVFCGASDARARTVYLAVRIGGGSHWNADQPLAT